MTAIGVQSSNPTCWPREKDSSLETEFFPVVCKVPFGDALPEMNTSTLKFFAVMLGQQKAGL